MNTFNKNTCALHNKLLVSVMTISLLSACATNPDELTATDASTFKYKAYDCKDVGSESDRIGRKITSLYTQLKKKADNDNMQMGVGLVLFWPALFFLEGGDGPEAIEYRTLKGEYEALQQVSLKKKCGIEFKDAIAEARAKEEAERKPILNVEKKNNFSKNGGNLTGDAASDRLSIADEIKKLSKLRDDNIISKAEFAEQKKKLLGM